MNRVTRHLTPGTVIACVALFVALGGGAYAATTLTKKSVKTQHIGNGAVTTAKLRNGAVTTAKLRNGAVTGAKIAPETIGSAQLAKGSVRSAQLGGGVVTEGKIKNAAVTANKIGDGAVTSGKLAPSFLGQLVRNVSYESAASGTNTEQTKTVTANCPTGKLAIAGGVRLSGELADTAVTGSTPSVVGSQRTGWSGFAHETGGGPFDDWSIEAFVVCAEL